MEAQEKQVALPLRSHTILGVCEAIGEDFGFNPTLLRIPFAASVLYSPLWAVVAYLAVGVLAEAAQRVFVGHRRELPRCPRSVALLHRAENRAGAEVAVEINVVHARELPVVAIAAAVEDDGLGAGTIAARIARGREP